MDFGAHHVYDFTRRLPQAGPTGLHAGDEWQRIIMLPWLHLIP